ncbi:ATP-binding protein [Nonomuraea sp. NPDC055795]
MFDKTLREDEQVYAMALRFTLATGQVGAVWRMVAVMVTALALVPAAPQHSTRISLQLLIPLVGAVLAWLHPQEHRLETLRISRFPRFLGAQVLARHLITVAGRATVSLAGLVEYIGLVSMVLLVAGPWPVPLPSWAWTIAMVFTIVFGWSIGRGVMLDSSWYRHDQSAAKFLRFARTVFPLAMASVGLVLFLAAPSAIPLSDPQRWVPNVLAAVALLTLYPLTFNYENALRSCRTAVALALVADRRQSGHRMHSLVKNPLRLLQREVLPSLEMIGFHAQHYLQDLEYFLNDAKREIENGPGSLRGSIQEIYERVQDLFPLQAQARLHFDETSNVTDLVGNDYDLVRIVLLDLVTNAMKADAQSVTVCVTRQGSPPQLAVTVTDDAPGVVVIGPRSSLEGLRQMLGELGAGGLSVDHHLTNGKTITASWRADVRRSTAR